VKLWLPTEAALGDAAGDVARAWRGGVQAPLLIGLRGPLGVGKTTWARHFLRGLGHAGRVPSPTYTLLEEYVAGGVTVVHVDLYRLSSDADVEFIGLRDRLDVPGVWVLVEWPERAPGLEGRCDLLLEFTAVSASARIVTVTSRTATGGRALASCAEVESKYSV